MVERRRELSGVPSVKALVAFMRASPLGPNHLPKALLPHTIILRVRISTHKYFWGGVGKNIQSIRQIEETVQVKALGQKTACWSWGSTSRYGREHRVCSEE